MLRVVLTANEPASAGRPPFGFDLASVDAAIGNFIARRNAKNIRLPCRVAKCVVPGERKINERRRVVAL
jgi:hypothetical protein